MFVSKYKQHVTTEWHGFTEPFRSIHICSIRTCLICTCELNDPNVKTGKHLQNLEN